MIVSLATWNPSDTSFKYRLLTGAKVSWGLQLPFKMTWIISQLTIYGEMGDNYSHGGSQKRDMVLPDQQSHEGLIWTKAHNQQSRAEKGHNSAHGSSFVLTYTTGQWHPTHNSPPNHPKPAS